MFLLSLFGANMTAFSILGASGHAFANGIVTFGLMASSSALVIPVSLLLIGTQAVGARPAPRLHDAGPDVPRSLGVRAHRHGHLRRAGRAAGALHHHRRHGRRHDARGGERRTVPYWLGGAIVSLVVMGYVFFGGMRGTAWVNAFQTMLFLVFGDDRRRS